MNWIDEVAFNDDGLIPAIAQDWQSGRILMVAWMNRDALQETVETNRAVYWSRSRARLWRKGEESGNTQRVHAVRLDCDGDVILLTVEQQGGIACHTGRESCFFRELTGEPGAQEWKVTDAVLKDPEMLYK